MSKMKLRFIKNVLSSTFVNQGIPKKKIITKYLKPKTS